MGEKNTKRVDFDPFADTTDLIGAVRDPEKVIASEGRKSVKEQAQKVIAIEKPITKTISLGNQPKRQEQTAILKFKVPKSDYDAAKGIIRNLEIELESRVDLSNVGRAWLTRFITSEKELMDAAKNHHPLKTPNSRNEAEIAEVDHAMAEIQSIAFRRAKPIK